MEYHFGIGIPEEDFVNEVPVEESRQSPSAVSARHRAIHASHDIDIDSNVTATKVTCVKQVLLVKLGKDAKKKKADMLLAEN